MKAFMTGVLVLSLTSAANGEPLYGGMVASTIIPCDGQPRVVAQEVPSGAKITRSQVWIGAQRGDVQDSYIVVDVAETGNLIQFASFDRYIDLDKLVNMDYGQDHIAIAPGEHLRITMYCLTLTDRMGTAHFTLSLWARP